MSRDVPRPKNRGAALILALGLATSACAGSGVSYVGASHPKRVEPRALESGDRPPPGYALLGRVRASCAGRAVQGAFEAAPLSELGCSVPLVLAALKDRAAREGGVFLDDPSCEVDGDPAAASEVSCSAGLFAPPATDAVAPVADAPPNLDPAGPAAPTAPAWGHVEDAWHVAVDFHPSHDFSLAAPVSPDQVEELAFARVSERHLGSLVSYCSAGEGCDPASVRGALRVAAARLGARSVVRVRCFDTPAGARCVAGVGTPRVLEPLSSFAGQPGAG